MTKGNMTIILLLAEKMLATLKIQIEIIYSLFNLCGKNKHRYPPHQQKAKKKTEETNSVTIIAYKATRG